MPALTTEDANVGVTARKRAKSDNGATAAFLSKSKITWSGEWRQTLGWNSVVREGSLGSISRFRNSTRFISAVLFIGWLVSLILQFFCGEWVGGWVVGGVGVGCGRCPVDVAPLRMEPARNPLCKLKTSRTKGWFSQPSSIFFLFSKKEENREATEKEDKEPRRRRRRK